MADLKKISELSPSIAASDQDVYPLVQNGSTLKQTLGALRQAIVGGWKAHVSNFLSSVDTLAARTSIGLGAVDNTADASKPVSAAQKLALDAKVGKSGDETIAGNKTFSGVVVAADLYAAGSIQTEYRMVLYRNGAAPFITSARADLSPTTPPKSAAPVLQVQGKTGSSTSNPDGGMNLGRLVVNYLPSGAGRVDISAYSGAAALASQLVLNGEDATVTITNGKLIAPSLELTTSLTSAGPVKVGQYTLTTMPSASAFSGYEIDVTNAVGGSKRCRSNGANWLILNTTTTVS